MRTDDRRSGAVAPSGHSPSGLSQSSLSQAQPNVPNADAAYAAAVARRYDILRLLPRLSDELKRLDIFIDTWCDMAGVPRPPKASKRAFPLSRNMPKEHVARECHAILSECGRALSRKELLDALAERGVELFGKDPAMVLSTMLWRSKDVIVRTHEGYLPVPGAAE